MEADLFDELVAMRRDLHRHPEPRFAEHRTAGVLADRMTALGLSVRTGIAETGVLARLETGRPGPHVLLRADMDALLTQDRKTVSYASVEPGVTHACGHDVHSVVVAGATELLCRDWASDGVGRLSVLFQPAEEIPYGATSGAATVLETGVLDDVPPDIVLGLHCWPQLSSGTIGLDDTTAMAAKLAFKVTVHGHGAHAATPQLGRDALLGASQIVVSLHTLMSRERDPGERVALNVGTIESGTSQSIVASSAEISGTVRTVRSEVATQLKGSIERMVAGVAAAHGLTAQVEWKNEMPAVINDPGLVALAHRTLPDVSSVDDVVRITEPPMTTDDFALLAQRWPGLYMKLGVSRPGADGWPSLHDGSFDVDERCVATGAEALASLAGVVLREGLDVAAAPDPSLAGIGEPT